MICEKCKEEFSPQKGLKRFCSMFCRNSRTWTDEDRKRKSESAKNSEKIRLQYSRKIVRNIDPAYRAKFTTTPCLHCKEPIVHNVRELRKYHKECWLKNSGGFKENSTIKHMEIYKGYQMDSGSEKKFAYLLDTNNIRWSKNKVKFYLYFDKDGKQRKYYPDFYLEDYDYWVEIKGRYYENENDRWG